MDCSANRGFDMRAAMFALMLVVPSASAQTAKDEAQIDWMWTEIGESLTSSGITKPMLRQFHYWLTGQYILGACAPFLNESDVLSWRTWWKDTPLEQSDIGRRLMLVAVDAYNDGVRDRIKKPLPRKQCVAVTVSWVAEMKRIATSNDAVSKAP